MLHPLLQHNLDESEHLSNDRMNITKHPLKNLRLAYEFLDQTDSRIRVMTSMLAANIFSGCSHPLTIDPKLCSFLSAFYVAEKG